ncbi:unnamed protein product [Sympodiomycopsis kandeliae]
MKPFDAGPRHERRDLWGYRNQPPEVIWPNGARVAVSFVVNYEEGAENTLLNGDPAAEAFLTENGVGATLSEFKGRELSRESSYAYGSRIGFWRLLDLFKDTGLTFTSWAVGKAVELYPEVVPAMEQAGCEVGSHCYRWINYASMSEEDEREHIKKAFNAIADASPTNKPALGWYTGRNSLNTRRLVYEHYKSLGLASKYYDSDSYDDDLPYYITAPTGNPSDEPALVVPYTLDVNDMKFGISPGFSTSIDFGAYLKDALQTYLDEATRSKNPRSSMITIGLHCRFAGRPGRFQALKRFVEEVVQLQNEGKVWVANRGDIADFWRKNFPPEQ